MPYSSPLRVLLLLWWAVGASAAPQRIDLPAQPAASALRWLAREADIDVLFSHDETVGIRANAVAGEFDPPTALARLLQGTGLAVVHSGAGRYVVRAIPQEADAAEALQRARFQLGPRRWTRVLRLYCTSGPRSRPVFRESEALIFALEGMLWLYRPEEGTQSLSLRVNRLEADQADPGPLLREAVPGFRAYADVTSLRARPMELAAPAPAPFGCLIACLARWDELRAGPMAPPRARLLSIYPRGEAGARGHTVLEYWQGKERCVYDPADPRRDWRWPATGDDPLPVATALLRHQGGASPDRVMALELRPEVPPGARPVVVLRRGSRPGASRS